MKMGAAERVSPLQGSLSFSPLTHHFVVGFASLCHGSSHDLPLSAAPLHPSTRGACRGPRLWRLGAWQRRASGSTRNPYMAENDIRFVKDPTRHGTEPCIFEAQSLPAAFRGKSKGSQSPAPSLMIMMACGMA